MFFSSKEIISAQTNSTIIINQVRGTECCDVGNIKSLKLQIESAIKLQLPTTFSLRYDVLKNKDFTNLIKKYQNNKLIEIGSFLEITPELAKDAGVIYSGSTSNWYEAQYVYLIGYDQEEREKIIDTYMELFKKTFDFFPKINTAWMIDSASLNLLKTKYHINVQQITREQMGVDSYTLYGGPVHYPYYPSKQWAMIPSNDNDSLIIVRQTITDPVYNYGDKTSSFTSQPNDYIRRKAKFDYFQHLFLQAHSQINNQDTFSLIGLENSMPTEIQDEFLNQLKFVKKWQSEKTEHQVLTASEFAENFKSKNPKNKDVLVYSGQDQENPNEKAWWITTPKYQIRIRLSGKELFISDLRFYDEDFTDPYNNSSAKKMGWWIVPFIIDGSRYGFNDQSQNFDFLFNDSLVKTKNTTLEPTRILLTKNINSDDLLVNEINNEIVFSLKNSIIAKLDRESFSITKNFIDQTQNKLLENIKKDNLWEIKEVDEKNDLKKYIFSKKNQENLIENARIRHYPILFPELSEHKISLEKTYIYKNNVYAVANRNPVRLVLFPKDEYGYPISINSKPNISSEPEVEKVEIKTQSGQNGMVFLDFISSKPISSKIRIEKDGWEENLNIYFAPDCKRNIEYCLKHPEQSIWYMRSFFGDKIRELKKKMEERAL